MVGFNPDISGGIQVQDYTQRQYIRGAGDVGQWISQVGQSAVDVAKAIDLTNQAAIRKQLNAGANKVAESYGGGITADPNAAPGSAAMGGVSAPSAGSTGGPGLRNQLGQPTGQVPLAIQPGLSALDKVQQIASAGGISQTDFDARGNAIVKNLIARYPKYEDIIRQEAQQRGLGDQMNLAHDTIAEATKMQSAAQSARNKDLDWMHQQMESAAMGDLHYPYDLTAFQDNPDGYFKQWQQGFAVRQKSAADASLIKQNFESLNATDKASQVDARLHASAAIDRSVHGILASQIDPILLAVNKANAIGHTPTPQETAQLGQSINGLRLSISQAVDAELSSDGWGAKLDSKDYADIKARALQQVDNLEYAYRNDKTGGVFNAVSQALKAQEDFSKKYVLDKYPALNSLNTIGGLQGGNAIIPILLQSWDAAGAGAATREIGLEAKAFSAQVATGAVTGNPVPSIGEGIATMAGAPNDPTKSATDNANYKSTSVRQMVEATKALITSPDGNPEVGFNAVKSLFAPDAEWSKFPVSARLSFYKRLTTPDVTDKIMQIAKVHPEAAVAYKQWLDNQIQTTLPAYLNQTISRLQGGGDYGKYIKVQFDPNQHHFTYEESPEVNATRDVTDISGNHLTAPAYPNEQAFDKDVQAILKDMNDLVDPADHALSRQPDGKTLDTGKYWQGVFERNNFSTDIKPIQGTPLYQKIFDWMKAEPKAMGAEPGAGGEKDLENQLQGIKPTGTLTPTDLNATGNREVAASNSPNAVFARNYKDTAWADVPQGIKAGFTQIYGDKAEAIYENTRASQAEGKPPAEAPSAIGQYGGSVAQQAYNYGKTKYGLDENSVLGLLANAGRESHFQPKLGNPDPANKNITDRGYFQLTNKSYPDFKSNGDITKEMDYIFQTKAGAKWLSMAHDGKFKTPEQASDSFLKTFEVTLRPGADKVVNRQWLNKFKAGI